LSAGFRRLDEEVRYQGALISVATATFESPDGERFERDVVHHPGAVSVVPAIKGPDGDYQVVLVRQYRAAIDAELLEVVAGKRDVAGEPPEETARRELAEEIGMIAGRLQRLAEFYNSPGFCDEHSFVFLGLDLTPTSPEAHGIEERFMTIERVALTDIAAMIASRQIVDAKTIIGLTLAQQALTARWL
jgi:8-oxo-dGTP pyrophosphatase MutT (NUDIX family)